MIGGLVLGVGVGVAIIGGPHFIALPWIVSVGLAKLTLLAAGGLMGAGAICLDSLRAKNKSGCANRPKNSLADISSADGFRELS